MTHQIITNIIGILLIITGLLDAWKYILQASKIKSAKSAKNISRKFINCAWIADLVKVLYGLIIMDFYIIITNIIALGTVTYMFWQCYLFYPYKKRGLNNFKRPNLITYIINSIIPNSKRKHL